MSVKCKINGNQFISLIFLKLQNFTQTKINLYTGTHKKCADFVVIFFEQIFMSEYILNYIFIIKKKKMHEKALLQILTLRGYL